MPDRLQRCTQMLDRSWQSLKALLPANLAVRVHVGLAPKLDLCHTGSVLAPLGGALVKTEKVATFSDGPISYVVSKMKCFEISISPQRNSHFRQICLELTLIPLMKSWADSSTTIIDLHHGRLSAGT